MDPPLIILSRRHETIPLPIRFHCNIHILFGWCTWLFLVWICCPRWRRAGLFLGLRTQVHTDPAALYIQRHPLNASSTDSVRIPTDPEACVPAVSGSWDAFSRSLSSKCSAECQKGEHRLEHAGSHLGWEACTWREAVHDAMDSELIVAGASLVRDARPALSPYPQFISRAVPSCSHPVTALVLCDARAGVEGIHVAAETRRRGLCLHRRPATLN